MRSPKSDNFQQVYHQLHLVCQEQMGEGRSLGVLLHIDIPRKLTPVLQVLISFNMISFSRLVEDL